jgi:hypothetical protein
MFHPDDPVVQPGGALEAWAGTRDGFLDRLDAILTDQHDNPLTHLRFLTAPEVGWRGAFWPLVKVANKLLEAASNGQVQFYGALGYSQDSASAASMNQHYAMGYYGYPAGSEHDRPVFDNVDPDAYHTSINQHDKKARKSFQNCTTEFTVITED